MLVIVGEGKVRNSSVAVQDARGAQRHYDEQYCQQKEIRGKKELTPSQYSRVTAGPIDRSKGLKVEGSSISSSCFAEVVLAWTELSDEVFSGTQSVQVGSGAAASAIVMEVRCGEPVESKAERYEYQDEQSSKCAIAVRRSVEFTRHSSSAWKRVQTR
jgi:hypothetical protein